MAHDQRADGRRCRRGRCFDSGSFGLGRSFFSRLCRFFCGSLGSSFRRFLCGSRLGSSFRRFLCGGSLGSSFRRFLCGGSFSRRFRRCFLLFGIFQLIHDQSADVLRGGLLFGSDLRFGAQTGGGDAGGQVRLVIHGGDGSVDGVYIQLQPIGQRQSSGDRGQLFPGVVAHLAGVVQYGPGLCQRGFDLRRIDFAAVVDDLTQGFALTADFLHEVGSLLTAGGQGLIEAAVPGQSIQALLLLTGVPPHLLDHIADAVVADLALTQVGLAFLPVIQQLLVEIAGLLDDLGLDLFVELGHAASDFAILFFGLVQLLRQLGQPGAELFPVAAMFAEFRVGVPEFLFRFRQRAFGGVEQPGMTRFRFLRGCGSLADRLLIAGGGVPRLLLQLVVTLAAFVDLLREQTEALLLFREARGGLRQIALQLAHQVPGGIQGLFQHRFKIVQHAAAAALHALAGGRGAVDHALRISGGFAGLGQGLLQFGFGRLRVGQFFLGFTEGLAVAFQFGLYLFQQAFRLVLLLPGGGNALLGLPGQMFRFLTGLPIQPLQLVASAGKLLFQLLT